MVCVQQFCIYCDSRSACYQIEDFGELLVKVNALELLRNELSRKRMIGKVGTGAMQDPYTSSEAKLNMTGQALEIIAEAGFPVHIATKSDLILKDLDTLVEINKVQASVCFTVTTADDELGKKVEPGAPLVSRRFRAAKMLAERGIQVGLLMMPILPWIEDTEENITRIVELAVEHGVSFIMPGMGLTMRERQREYFYRKLDELFPGLKQQYQRRYGLSYGCSVPNARRLYAHFEALRVRYGLGMTSRHYVPHKRSETRGEQLSLF
ncbi:MAG: radical SAM protein [Anaerolineae bacterium]|nr:radical SAM protein [Anaerolineae bacterium]